MYIWVRKVPIVSTGVYGSHMHHVHLAKLIISFKDHYYMKKVYDVKLMAA